MDTLVFFAIVAFSFFMSAAVTRFFLCNVAFDEGIVLVCRLSDVINNGAIRLNVLGATCCFNNIG